MVLGQPPLRGQAKAQAQRYGPGGIVIHIALQKACPEDLWFIDCKRGYHNLGNCHT
jgi:hypothetical protein